jgi:hypothetical protein
MNVTLPIPDELAARLGEAGDVARRALEAFALAEYQAGRLTQSELRQLLGFETRYELDGFLKAHGIFRDYTQADLDRERENLDRLASPVARIHAFRAGKTLGGLDPAALIREGRR